MRAASFTAACFALSFCASEATVGIDVSSAVTESQFKCLQSPGGQGAIEFVIPRVYRSSGTVDPNGAQTIKNARAAGIKHVDGYIFPCRTCDKTGGDQVRETVEHLKKEGAEFGMLWYDIETYKWGSDLGANQAFIRDMVETGQNLGIKAGIYSGYRSWSAIVGRDWDFPHSAGLHVWYAHYDSSKSFDDFQTTERGGYGGWKTPSIKQYIGDHTSCGVSLDYNWYPSESTDASITMV